MTKDEKKEFEKLEELRKMIEASPMTQKIIAEKAAKTLTKRQEAALKIEGLRKNQGELILKLREAVKEKEAKYLKVKVDLDAAQDEINSARFALSSESQSFDSAISRQEQILIESADLLLDESIVFFNGKLDYFRSPGRISSNPLKAERNLFTETKTVTYENNAEAVRGAIFYCQAAIKELEIMKLSPELDIQKIEAIKAGVPSIDIFTEVTGERSLPKPWNVNPRSLLPSDSEMDWKFQKVMEKARKILGRQY